MGWAFSPGQQSRLATLDPPRASVLMALHAASIYVGIAAGSGLGALVSDRAGLGALGPAAAVTAIGALGVLLLSRRGRGTPERP